MESTLPVEFLERAIYLMGESGFMQPQLGAVVALDGRLDGHRLERALRLLMSSEPVLACRFVPDSVPPVWQKADAADAASPLEVRLSADAESEAEAFVAAHIDPCAGPQMRAALFRAEANDLFAISMTHLAVDGGALKEALYLVADYYRTLATRPDWTPALNVDGLRRPLVEAGLLQRARALMQGSDALLPKTEWGVADLGLRGRPSYLSATLDPAVLPAVKKLARAEGCTVNDLLLAAYYRSLYRLLDPAPGAKTPIQVSCELRKHLPPQTKTALANISSAWNITLPFVEEEDFAATLKRVAEKTSAWKRSGEGRSSAIGVQLMSRLTAGQGLDTLRKQMAKGAKATTSETGYPTLTNIGVIDDGKLDFGHETAVADAWLLGPIGMPTGVVLTASTFKDRLHLSIGTDIEAMDEGLAQSLVRDTALEIEDFWRANLVSA